TADPSRSRPPSRTPISSPGCSNTSGGYARRLGPSPRGSEDPPTRPRPPEVHPAPAETTETSEEAPEPEEPPQPGPALGVSDDEGSEPPDARTLKERINCLDERLAR